MYKIGDVTAEATMDNMTFQQPANQNAVEYDRRSGWKPFTAGQLKMITISKNCLSKD